MYVRQIRESDLDNIRKIHEKFYKEEFDFPDFTRNFLGSFAILNEGKIVVAGGVRTIAECVIITDLDVKPKPRGTALYKALDMSVYMCKVSNHDQLHCFVQGDMWIYRLKKDGFKPCSGTALYLNVGD